VAGIVAEAIKHLMLSYKDIKILQDGSNPIRESTLLKQLGFNSNSQKHTKKKVLRLGTRKRLLIYYVNQNHR
jgi:hypothetical protein